MSADSELPSRHRPGGVGGGAVCRGGGGGGGGVNRLRYPSGFINMLGLYGVDLTRLTVSSHQPRRREECDGVGVFPIVGERATMEVFEASFMRLALDAPMFCRDRWASDGCTGVVVPVAERHDASSCAPSIGDVLGGCFPFPSFTSISRLERATLSIVRCFFGSDDLISGNEGRSHTAIRSNESRRRY